MRCTSIIAMLLLSAGLASAQDSKSTGLDPKEVKEGFVSIFDGKTLDGWQGDLKGYTAENGAMLCKPGGKIFTTKQYANFILRFEFTLPPGANNGVGIRTPTEGDPAYNGMEIQILDDGHEKYKGWLHPYQRHGSIYGVVTPQHRAAFKPTGQWNEEEILADGSCIKVTVNGKLIVEADLSKIDKTVDDKPHPGLHNAKGYIGWLGHGDPVEFRNVRIKELP
jgi:hypothetical protein